MVIANLNPVRNWLAREYPRPQVNPEWLQGCCTALQEATPGVNTRDLIHAVNLQLLLSSLTDSCLPHTGLPDPDTLDDLHGETLFQKDHCLVMVMSIMEVGHSAFQLQTTMENRKEALSGVRRIRRIRNPQADGEEEDEVEEDDDDEAIPPYPRGMLSLELSDGFNTLKAMEYKRIDGLTLGETALGSKILLKGVQIRRGILMLTPANTVLKGYMVEEIEMHQGRLFQNALLRALGKPELPLEDEVIEEEQPLVHLNGAPQLPPNAFDDDRFSEYEGDMEYDLIASGIDLAAPGRSDSNPNRAAAMLTDHHKEEEGDYPGDDDFEALMVMQERAQARAQAPSRSTTTRAAAVPKREETDEDWEILAAMEAEAEESNSNNLLRNDRGPKPPARLTLGLPFHKPAVPSSSRHTSSVAEDEDPTTRSRFFGKADDAQSSQKPASSKKPAASKVKKSSAVYLDDDEELFPPMEYVYNQESEDEDYVPTRAAAALKRKTRSRAGQRDALEDAMAVDDDDDDDDLEDSQKENRPAIVKGKTRGSANRDSVPRAKKRVPKHDPDDDVIEISD